MHIIIHLYKFVGVLEALTIVHPLHPEKLSVTFH